MKKRIVLSALLIGAFLPLQVTAQDMDCRELVEAYFSNERWLLHEPQSELVWPDGHIIWPDGDAQEFSGVSWGGTALNQRWHYIKTLESRGDGSVFTKVVRLRLHGMEYNGDYSVEKSTFACERRQGELRILSRTVLQRENLHNVDGRGFNPM